MYRMVIAGCGEIAWIKHAPALQQSDRWEIAGFYNRTPERAQRYLQRFGGRFYPTFADILADDTVDAVDLCTPVGTHAELACAALRAGKHVLCEKPMAETAEQAADMVAAARASGKKLMIYLNQRLYPAHQKAKQLLDDGAIGTLIHYRTELGYDWDELRYNAAGQYIEKPFKEGVLSEMGIHRVDLMRYFTGSPISEVLSWGDRLERCYPDGKPYGCYDNSVTILKHQNGVVGTLATSWSIHGGEDRTTRLYGTRGVMTVYGKDTALSIDWPDGSRTDYDLGPIPPQYASRQPMVPGVIPTDLVGAFADAIANDADPIIDGQAGYEGMRVIDAMYRSAAEHRWIRT